jgi:hypothetical protein
MSQQFINVGASPNDGQGNTIRASFTICNSNFSQLFARAQANPPPTLVGSLGDLAGMYAYDSTYFYYCFADYDGSSTIWGQVSQSGNVTVEQILFGNTSVGIPAADANVVVSVAGVSNVAVFTTAGLNIVGAASATGNIAGNYFIGNGSQLTGLPAGYTNSNAATFLAAFGSNTISTTGNVTASYFIGDGSQLTNLPPGNYSNANVAAYLPTYTGNVSAGNVSVSGNVTAAFFTGNGAGLTGVVATGNVGSANMLANGTSMLNIPVANGNIVGNVNGVNNVYVFTEFGANVAGYVGATGNVDAGNLHTSGVVSATGNVRGGNINTAGLITATGTITGGNILTGGLISATGNITGNYILGNGSLLTGIVTNYSNANVAAYLPTYTGNVSAGNVSATGNIVGANVGSTGQVNALGNITGANIITSGAVTATGNITGGNITTAGLISVTGNVTGGNINTAGNVVAGNVVTTTGTFRLPAFTSAELANTTPTPGDMVYNTTVNQVQAWQYDATNVFAWVSLSVSTYQ